MDWCCCCWVCNKVELLAGLGGGTLFLSRADGGGTGGKFT